MVLSAVLDQSGTPVESAKTDAAVTLRMVEGDPTVTSIALSTVGAVPETDQETVEKAAAEANARRPVSLALAGVAENTLEAMLA